MTSLIVTAVLLGLLLGAVSLNVGLLWIGLRWAKVERVTIARLAAAVALIFVVQFVVSVAAKMITPPSNYIGELLLGYGQFAVSMLAVCLVIQRVFNTAFLRAVLAWLPTLAGAVLVWAVMLFVVRPFVFEAFHIPTNAMAPTLLGEHIRGTCQECGGPAYGTGRDYSPDQLVICDKFHVTHTENAGLEVFSGDRILVAKFARPQRWDLIVYRTPEDPALNYVKRLVGMPGEVITIEDGRVFADGKPLPPPESLRGLSYDADLGGRFPDYWGSPRKPARLGPNEYFVLGDFSTQSLDSRNAQTGAPGHPPYAVPQSNVIGVVTHIYWPLSRFRVFD